MPTDINVNATHICVVLIYIYIIISILSVSIMWSNDICNQYIFVYFQITEYGLCAYESFWS